MKEDVEQLAQRLQRVSRYLSTINMRRGSPLTDHDLEDLGQDAVIRIWSKLRSYHGHGTLDNWVYRFCLLEFMNRFRKLSRGPRHVPLVMDVGSEPSQGQEGLDEYAFYLGRLPEHESVVVELRHFEDRSFSEIAEQLELPKGTVKTRYYSALTRLRSYMGSTAQEESA